MKQPSIVDLLGSYPPAGGVGAATASSEIAHLLRAAPAERPHGSTFLDSLGGAAPAPAREPSHRLAPTPSMPDPFASSDPQTLAAIAALKGSAYFAAPAAAGVRDGTKKKKLLAARDQAEQLTLDRAAAAEARAEQAVLAAGRLSRRLATLRAGTIRLEEERDAARDFVVIAQDESALLRADNVALSSKVSAQAAAAAEERESLRADNARLRARVEALESALRLKGIILLLLSYHHYYYLTFTRA